MAKQILILSLLLLFLLSCKNKDDAMGVLSSLEDKELNLKIRCDTILENISFGMHRSKVDSILQTTGTFYREGTDYHYKFKNVPSLGVIPWHVSKSFMYHNDTLINFSLLTIEYSITRENMTLDMVCAMLIDFFEKEYGEPSYMADKLNGPYYWICGNREIVIEMSRHDKGYGAISINYEDMSKRITSEMLPLELDADNNTYTKAYWEKVKSIRHK